MRAGLGSAVAGEFDPVTLNALMFGYRKLVVDGEAGPRQGM